MDYRQPKFYRFSEDSIWLAKTAATNARKGVRTILDVGSGCGVVGIETANRIPSIERLVCLEPQAEFKEFIESNRDLLRPGVELEYSRSTAQGWDSLESFDLVVSNPPYFKQGEGRISPDPNRAMCRSFSDIDLKTFLDLIRGRLVKNGEAFVLGHHSNSDLKLVQSLERVSVLKTQKAVSILNIRG